jgi:hypothetical protein
MLSANYGLELTSSGIACRIKPGPGHLRKSRAKIAQRQPGGFAVGFASMASTIVDAHAFRDGGAVFLAHVSDPAGLDDKLLALPGVGLLQEHELFPLQLRLGNEVWRKCLDDSDLALSSPHYCYE